MDTNEIMTSTRTDESDWRDRLGQAVFTAMRCTHDYESRWCEVCWENMQAACRVFERMPKPTAPVADPSSAEDRLGALVEKWFVNVCVNDLFAAEFDRPAACNGTHDDDHPNRQ